MKNCLTKSRRRIVFVHPSTAVAATPTAFTFTRTVTPIALAAQDPNYPEYWAVQSDDGGSGRTLFGPGAGLDQVSPAGQDPRRQHGQKLLGLSRRCRTNHSHRQNHLEHVVDLQQRLWWRNIKCAS